MDDLSVLWCFVFVVDISSYFSRVKMWQRPTLRRRRTLTFGLLQVGVLFSFLFLLRAPERRVLLKKGAEILHLHTSHLTSSHLTYSHLMSAHLTSSHLTSGHLTSLNLASADIASSQLTYSHLMSTHLTSSHLTVRLQILRFSLLFSSLLFSSFFLSFYLFFFCSSLFLYYSLFFSSLLYFSPFLLFSSLLFSSLLSLFSLICLFLFSLKAVWPRASRKFATVAHEMRFDRQTLRKNAILTSHARPWSTKWGSIATKKVM